MVLMSMRVFSVDGLLHLTKLEEQARDTVSLQKIITPYADEERMYKHALEIWRDNPKDHERDAVNSVATFAIVCGLLCCKNVLTEERAATRQIRRDRERRGLLPLVRWHILKVQVGAQRKQPRSGPSLGGPHEPLASHFVRGHFKTFTKEKPLLGRAVGTFWWSQHVAGRADRVVLKDYEIEKE
jgi:hypothetical protein